MAGLTWMPLLVLLSVALGQETDKVIRLVPQTEEQLKLVAALENDPAFQVDFWKEAHKPGMAADIQVQGASYGALAKYLHKNGLEFTIQMFDVQRQIQVEKTKMGRSSGFTFNDYHNYDEIVSELQRLVKVPTKAKLTLGTAGSSYERRQQWYMEIKGVQRANKPVFFMNCGMHAREWITQASCMFFIHGFVYRYGKDPQVTRVLDKMDFIIMPVLNVDGYVYTWQDGTDERGYQKRFWRKTRKPNRGYPWCLGTDPNRNFDYKWGTVGASGYPCHHTYYGERPHSEVEIRNVVALLKRLGGRLKGYMDVHAYSQLWMIPWGYTKELTPDNADLMRVSQAGVRALTSSYGTSFKSGTSSNIIYENSGGSKDYTYGTLGVKYSFALELRDQGQHGFVLPKEQILPVGIETFRGILAMAEAMHV